MIKSKLIILTGLLVVLASVLSGCGGGGADTSTAAVPPGPAGMDAAMAPPAAPAGPPGAIPSPAPAPTAPAPGMDAMSGAPAPAATSAVPAADGAPKADAVSLKSVIPAGRIKRVSEKQWDGSVLKYLVFQYQRGNEEPVTVELPCEFENEMMTRNEWVNMFTAYAAPTEIMDPTREAAQIRAQLGLRTH